MSGRDDMLVIDGSVLLAWAVQTPASSRAAGLLEEGVALLATESALAEAVEGALRLVRDGHMSAADASEMPRFITPLLHALVTDAPLMGRAAELAGAHGLGLPPAAALALAQARGAVLATLDPMLAKIASEVLGEGRVRHISA